MGMPECPSCGASSTFGVLESEWEDKQEEGKSDDSSVISNKSFTEVSEPKFSSLTDENMFLEPFVIPLTKPPEDDNDPEPVVTPKKRKQKKKKIAVEEDVAASIVEPTTETSAEEDMDVALTSDSEKGSEDFATPPIPVYNETKKNSVFEMFASEAAVGLELEPLPDVDISEADNVTGIFDECNIQPLEASAQEEFVVPQKEKTSKWKGKRKTGEGSEPSDVAPETAEKTTVSKIFKKEPKPETSVGSEEKKVKNNFPRELAISCLFFIGSLFFPILFIPCNTFLNKVPKEEVKTTGRKFIVAILNIGFYINLLCLVVGVFFLTKALALNYQTLFAGNLAAMSGEFAKIAPLMLVRSFSFWGRIFSPDTIDLLKGMFDTYFSEFASDLASLKHGFDIKIIFSLFDKIGVPLMVLLGAIGITGKISIRHKLKQVEKKLEELYRIGNYSGEALRGLKEQKVSLTFKKKSFTKIIVVLIILTLLFTKGYPLVSKILPLLEFIKEDINNANK